MSAQTAHSADVPIAPDKAESMRGATNQNPAGMGLWALLREDWRTHDRAWLEQLIRTVGLEDRRTHRPSELSGGQQQRVAVARALVSKPAVVFADEPTGNLDSKASEDVLRLLRQAVDEFDQTVIMVTHDPEAAAFADRLLTLRDGRIVSDAAPGTADEVIELMKQLG